MIGLIAVTGGGRTAAERLAAAWPGQTRTYDGPARQALARGETPDELPPAVAAYIRNHALYQ